MITIIAKRWFSRSCGNTYHSVTVLLDGKEVGYEPFTYGYGDHYRQTAHKILQKAGICPTTGESLKSGMDKDYYEFMLESRDTSKYLFIVSDVSRKKDL